MNLRINAKTLREALALVAPAIKDRTTLPILENVAVEAKAGLVTLTTNNLDLALRTTAACSISEAGSITVPHERLALVAQCDGDIDLRVSGSELMAYSNDGVIKGTGSASFIVPAIHIDEFPEFPKRPDGCIQFDNLIPSLRKVYAFMSRDEMRFVLNGVLLDGNSVVASDGRRITAINPRKVDDKNAVIIPAATVNALVGLEQILGDSKATGARCAEDCRFWITYAQGPYSLEVYTKTIEGKYPNYFGCVPKQVKHNVLVPAEPLRTFAVQCAAWSVTRQNSVSLNFEDNRLTLSAGHESTGRVSMAASCDWPKGKFKIALNAAYFVDALMIDPKCTEYHFGLTDELTPLVVRFGELWHVLMPMRMS